MTLMGPLFCHLPQGATASKCLFPGLGRRKSTEVRREAAPLEAVGAERWPERQGLGNLRVPVQLASSRSLWSGLCGYAKLMHGGFCNFQTSGPTVLFLSVQRWPRTPSGLLWSRQGFRRKEPAHDTHWGNGADYPSLDPGCATYLLLELGSVTSARSVPASVTVEWER